MHEIRRTTSPVALALVFLAAFAAEEVRAEHPPVLPLSARINDQAGVLGARAPSLEEKLAAYERSTGHQIAVLIIPSLQGEPLEQFSLRVAEQWRLGDARRDDGVLLVVAMQERALRLEVGYGLEGAISDAVAARIIREEMTPRFQRGDIAGGVEACLDAVMRAAQAEATGPSTATPSAPPGSTAPSALWLVPMVLFLSFLAAPRPLRAFLFLVLGGVVGLVMLHSLGLGIALALIGAALGLALPRARASGMRGPGPWWVFGPMMAGRGGRGVAKGGFRGAGGKFGGGGASGRW